jgi:hypothetical protein
MAAGMKPLGGGGTISQMFQGAPKASSFIQYGAGNTILPPDAQRFGPVGSILGASAGKPTVQYTQQFNQAGFDTATADYNQAMKDMREDAADYVSEWSNKMAPAPGRTGQARAAPEGRLVVAGPPPADEDALYGRPQQFPGISSIVNLRKRKERGMA